MADLDSIKARIRALRARTVENGCTEAEALAAAGKVMELLARHGLAADEPDITTEDFGIGAAMRPTLEPLFKIVAWVCHCELMLVIGHCENSLRYVGRDPWPEAAAYLHSVVVGAARRAQLEFRASPAYRSRAKRSSRQVAEHHFLTGFMQGLSAKLLRLKQTRHEEEAQQQDLAIARQAVDQMATGEMTRSRAPRQSERYGDALARGYQAGKNTHVGWGLGQAGAGGLLKGGSHG